MSAEPPQRLLDQAFRQVVRGSNNPASVIGPYSLLEDMVGNVSISVATITSVSPLCNGQLLELTMTGPAGNLTITSANVRRLGGCVITDLGNPNVAPEVRNRVRPPARAASSSASIRAMVITRWRPSTTPPNRSPKTCA